MKIRKSAFIIVLLLLALAAVAMWPSSESGYKPLAVEQTTDGLIARYDAEMAIDTVVTIPAQATGCRIEFNNHRQIQYGAGKPDGSSFIRWRDKSGRIHAVPVVRLPLPNAYGDSRILPLGKDYETYVSVPTERLRIVAITMPDAGKDHPQVSRNPEQQASEATKLFAKKLNVDLGEIAHPAVIENPHVQTWEEIACPRNGEYLALSSFDQAFYRIHAQTGAKEWRYSIPDGQGASIAISPDGATILGGERSADGNLYGIEAKTGRPKWTFPMQPVIGGLEDTLPGEGLFAENVKPAVREIDVTPQGTAISRAYRMRRVAGADGGVRKERRSVLFCHEIATGRQLWKYPRDGIIIDTYTSQIHVSIDGRYFGLVHFETVDFKTGKVAPTMVSVHSTDDARELWRDEVLPNSRHFKTVRAYAGISLSQDGAWAAVPLQDGRIILYDNRKSINSGKAVRSRTIDACLPIDAVSMPIMTYMRPIQFTKDNDLIVVTGNTYATPAARGGMPPLDHPDANSVFAYNLAGELLWRFTGEGNCSDVTYGSHEGRELLAVTTAHNIRDRNPDAHGVHLFDLRPGLSGSERLLGVYKTEGICVNTVLTPNLRRLWVIEAPIDMNPTRQIDVRGRHRLHCFEVPE